MIRHTLRILWNERRDNVVIILELALIGVILWYLVDTVYTQLRNYYSPTGYDIENTFIIKISELPEGSQEYITGLETSQKTEAIQTIIQRISHAPGVEVASYSFGSRPGSNSNSNGTLITKRGSSVDHLTFLRRVSPSFLEVFKYQPIGMSRAEAMKVLEDGQVIITRNMEELILPDGGSLVGDTIYADLELTQPEGTIGAVVEDVRYSKARPAHPAMVMKIEDDVLSIMIEQGWVQGVELCVRVAPEAREGFKERFEKEVAPTLSIANYRFSTITYIPDTLAYEKETIKDLFLTQGLISLFLLVNVLLGVTGVFWFRTVKRRSQIGLRISLGATPAQAQWQIMLEGILMLAVALLISTIVMAVVFYLELLNVELIPHDLRRFLEVLLITTLLMLAAVLLSVWLPTRRSRRIPPAQALREE